MIQGKEITLENELKRIKKENLYNNTDLYIKNEKGYKKQIDVLVPEHTNIFGVDLKLTINNILELKYGRWPTFDERKKFIEQYKEQFERQLNIEGIKKGVDIKIKEIAERNKKIQILYNELYEVYSSLGYKSDIKKLEEINELLYCEAETFLNKMEDKIFEKKTAKAIRCYKKLMEIRNKSNEIIECN